jgi:hypothetical protein
VILMKRLKNGWKSLFEIFWKYEDKIDIKNYFVGILRLLILL